MPAKPISRRAFLKATGIGLGASSIACCGLGYAAVRSTSDLRINPTVTETPSFSFGEQAAPGGRILVTYATRTGSTVGVAAAIGETLGQRGFSAEVKPARDAPALDGYQRVIMGSAINGGKWLPEAVDFVANNRATLNQMPAALFCVHIMNLGEDERSRRNRLAYLDDIRAQIQPVDEAFFAGLGMNPDEQSPFIRWAYLTFKVGPVGDCRDWDQIRAWGQTVFA